MSQIFCQWMKNPWWMELDKVRYFQRAFCQYSDTVRMNEVSYLRLQELVGQKSDCSKMEGESEGGVVLAFLSLKIRFLH